MRTTLVLDDAIYQRAKLTAVTRGVTVASVIEEALHLLLAQQSTSPADLGPMPIDDSPGWLRPGIDLNDTSALLGLLDEGRDLDVLR